MNLELNGSDGNMIYRLHHIGGSQDGVISNAFRPYYEMIHGKEVYRADEEPPDHEHWVDDFTRDIFLKWVPNESP